MNWQRNRKEGGSDPLSERPALTPEQAASAAYILGDVDKKRAVVMPVRVEDFVLYPDIQVRVGGLDENAVKAYTNILLEGGQFADPVIAFSENRQPPYILADGFHRLEAHQRAAQTVAESPEDWPEIEGADALLVVRCEVRYGGYAEAYTEAETANMAHGKALKAPDLFHIFERRTTREHEWVRLSNNAIARLIGVSHRTVQRWRDRVLERNPDNRWALKSAEGTERTTSRGTKMNVGGLQEAREKEREPEDVKQARSVAKRMKSLADDFDQLAYPEAAQELRAWLADWQQKWGL